MPNQQILRFLPWIRTFEAAARRLNFTEAAHELGLSQAAVSQQIRLLEAAFGEKLFERQRRGVVLTAAGAAFLPHVQSALHTLARSVGELFGESTAIRLELRSPISFAALWLAPRLTALSRDLPHISLDVRTIHVPADYRTDEDGFDIRFGTGEFSGRTAHRLSSERLVPMAAPPAAASRSFAEAAQQLPLLNVAGAREMWPAWFDKAELPFEAIAKHRFDTFIAALAAARAGAGILLGSRPLVDALLERSELLCLSNVELESERGHFLTYPSNMAFDRNRLDLLNWLLSQREA